MAAASPIASGSPRGTTSPAAPISIVVEPTADSIAAAKESGPAISVPGLRIDRAPTIVRVARIDQVSALVPARVAAANNGRASAIVRTNRADPEKAAPVNAGREPAIDRNDPVRVAAGNGGPARAIVPTSRAVPDREAAASAGRVPMIGPTGPVETIGPI